MTGDDRRKPDFKLNRDAETEAMAKVDVAELPIQGFLFDDLNPAGVAVPRKNAPGAARGRAAGITGVRTDSGAVTVTARAWTQPQGHADIAPSRHDRIEGDGYLTLDAPWVVPALLQKVPEIGGRILEPAAGRGHLRSNCAAPAWRSCHSICADTWIRSSTTSAKVTSASLTTLKGFDFVVTNLPYSDLEELAGHLIDLGVRDRCGAALLVRSEWIVPKARRALVHEHPHFAGTVMLTARPRWVERIQDSASPRHNFAWAVWSGVPRVADPWLRFAGR
jgi:hypothetical protein